MRIGYARVSTDDQTLDLQRDALKRSILRSARSVKTTTRPQLEACLKSLREGDILVVWRLDRLGPSAQVLVTSLNSQTSFSPAESI
jgi:DNA invertase Pin-like site-specific DNA recombinase